MPKNEDERDDERDDKDKREDRENSDNDRGRRSDDRDTRDRQRDDTRDGDGERDRPRGGGRLQAGSRAYDDALADARSEASMYRRRYREVRDEMSSLEARYRAEEAKWGAERAELSGELERAKRTVTELEPLREKLGDIEKSRRAELLERLPEKIRSEYDGDGISLDELERVCRIQGVITPTPGTSRGAHAVTDAPPEKPVTELSTEDLAKLREADPERYQAALKEIAVANITRKRSIFG